MPLKARVLQGVPIARLSGGKVETIDIIDQVLSVIKYNADNGEVILSGGALGEYQLKIDASKVEFIAEGCA